MCPGPSPAESGVNGNSRQIGGQTVARCWRDMRSYPLACRFSGRRWRTSPSLLSFITMNAPAIKLVAIDLDGTLLDPDEHISERNRRAVASVRAGGAEVVLVTARGFHRARPFAQPA